MFLDSITPEVERLVISPLVGIYPPRLWKFANLLSSIPPSFDPAATRGCHLPYSDLPRLLPLSHQSVESVHPLKDAQAYS